MSTPGRSPLGAFYRSPLGVRDRARRVQYRLRLIPESCGNTTGAFAPVSIYVESLAPGAAVWEAAEDMVGQAGVIQGAKDIRQYDTDPWADSLGVVWANIGNGVGWAGGFFLRELAGTSSYSSAIVASGTDPNGDTITDSMAYDFIETSAVVIDTTTLGVDESYTTGGSLVESALPHEAIVAYAAYYWATRDAAIEGDSFWYKPPNYYHQWHDGSDVTGRINSLLSSLVDQLTYESTRHNETHSDGLHKRLSGDGGTRSSWRGLFTPATAQWVAARELSLCWRWSYEVPAGVYYRRRVHVVDAGGGTITDSPWEHFVSPGETTLYSYNPPIAHVTYPDVVSVNSATVHVTRNENWYPRYEVEVDVSPREPQYPPGWTSDKEYCRCYLQIEAVTPA